jgi:membrane peptidoglycan carboxypeptidase
MWETATNPPKAWDLNQMEKIEPTNPFFYHVGFGQYPITVMDHATGTATMASHGIYNKPHFVTKVEQKDRKTGAWVKLAQGDEVLNPQQTIRAAVADEVTSVLKKVAPKLSNGTDAAGKTGTWENGLKKEDGKTSVYPNTNSHVWFTGYTAEMATAIWFGNGDKANLPIKEAGTGDLLKAKNMGSTFPKEVWRKYMDDYNKAAGVKASKLAVGSGGAIGSKDIGTGKSPTPDPGTTCMFPGTPLCPGTGGGGGNGGGNGNGGGGLPTVIPTTPSRRP